MSPTRLLLFDLDGTLYSADNGYVRHIRENIFCLLCKKGIASSRDEAEAIWRPLFQRYNQSYKGLRIGGGYSLNRDEYWSNHRAGMEEYLFPDLALRSLLKSLPYRKVIFTNCREKEAEEALERMQLRDCFESIYGADFMGEYCKPDPESFQMVLDDLKIPACEIVYFEDSVKNLQAGNKFGLRGVLINGLTAEEENHNSTSSKSGQIDFVEATITTLSDNGEQLRGALPYLFSSDLA